MDDPRSISRDDAARMGVEAVTIAKRGHYLAPSGRRVDLGGRVVDAMRGTTSHPPAERIELPSRARAVDARVEVRCVSTLVAARDLVVGGFDPVALNFASARHPGGGFLTGARAQEESLCRSSGLFVCLEGQPMYAHHDRHRDALYTSWMIYSPEVPVFRDDDGALLEEPWLCAFVTAAATNAKQIARTAPDRAEELAPAMHERIERVLALSAAAGHDAVVLGAWGCGAFGCDPAMVAELFGRALEGPFRGAFARVVFAVLDTTPERRFIGPFERQFVPDSRLRR